MYLSRLKIQEAMCSKGLKTFTELADLVGITKNQLSLMLSENYNPLKSKVMNLCSALDIAPDSIIETSTFSMQKQYKEKANPDDVTAIELFAGAGGLALGLEEAGIKTLEYVEFDKTCCETLRINRPSWNVVCDDIHNVNLL